MRKKWEEDESGWHKLPPRAWPPRQPKADELTTLERLAASGANSQAQFDLATCQTFNLLDPAAGLATYRALAEDGHVDSMVALGVVLLEGIGCDPAEVEGLQWIRRACAHGHPQGQYELGVAHYLGSFEAHDVKEDEGAAFALFEAAAAQEHTSALFMLAEFLREGAGCTADEARAVSVLHQAAQRGHRMARQRVLEYLDADRAQYGLQPTPRQRAQQHASSLPVLPEGGSEHFCVFRGDGERVSMAELIAEARGAEVVLLGESHDDPVAHSLEAYILVSLAAARDRCALSLEMFERDVQVRPGPRPRVAAPRQAAHATPAHGSAC